VSHSINATLLFTVSYLMPSCHLARANLASIQWTVRLS